MYYLVFKLKPDDTYCRILTFSHLVLNYGLPLQYLISRYTVSRVYHGQVIWLQSRIKACRFYRMDIHIYLFSSTHTTWKMSPITESFVTVSKDSDFPIQNIPFGVFSTSEKVNTKLIFGLRLRY